jgi:hypothetical protein
MLVYLSPEDEVLVRRAIQYRLVEIDMRISRDQEGWFIDHADERALLTLLKRMDAAEQDIAF